MKTFYLVVLLLPLFLGLANADNGEGSGNGNGGGGVHRNGKYMTFYSAGFYVEPQPQDTEEGVPGINTTVYFISKFPYWTADEKSILVGKILPSDRHKYYKVKKDKFTKETLARLLAEFSRVTGENVDNLELFAVTNTSTNETFLLPAFYELSQEDKAAILFHEAYWLLNKDSGYSNDYQRTVAAELAFQAAFSQPQNSARALDLLKYYGNEQSALPLVANLDIQSGALKDLLQPKGIPFTQLFGSEFFNCKKATAGCYPGLIAANIYLLSQNYPKSAILRRLYQKIPGDPNYYSSGAVMNFQGTPGIDWWREFYFKNLVESNVIYGSKRSIWGKDDNYYVNLATCFLDVANARVGKIPVNCEKGITGSLMF